MALETAIATFIDRVNDFQAVLNAEGGNRLTREEYFRCSVSAFEHRPDLF